MVDHIQQTVTVVTVLLLVASLLAVAPVAVSVAEEDEPNDSREDAQSIATGEEVTGQLSEGDEDFFAFTVERGETINLTGFSTGDDAEFRLQNPDGDEISSGRSREGSTTTGTTATTSGTYYLRILVPTGAEAPIDYSFTVDTYETDDFEPNEDRANASRLYENPFPSDTATLSIGDEDFFSFTADTGETINLTGFIRARGADAGFRLQNPDGDDIAGGGSREGSTTIGTTATTSGTHYLRVDVPTAATPPIDYNFTVEVPGETLGLPNDRFERGNPPVGNQNQENAPTVTSGTYSLAIVDDDRDVLAVDLDEGERVRATIDFAHDENDLALSLTDASGEAVNRSDTDTDGEQVAFTAPSGGTYYLQVSGEAGAATTYEMDLAVLERTDVTLGPGGLTAPPDTTATVNVSVTGASAGLSKANLSLRSTNTSVLRIQSVDAVGDGSVSTTVADDGGSVTANVTGLDRTARGTVTVAEVTVATVGNGSATLSGDASVAARPSVEYPLGSVQGTSVTVAAGEEISTSTPESSDGEGTAGDGDGGDGAGDSADGSDGAGDGAGDGADGSDGAGDRATTSSDGPGFGVVASLLALTLMALLARKR